MLREAVAAAAVLLSVLAVPAAAEGCLLRAQHECRGTSIPMGPCQGDTVDARALAGNHGDECDTVDVTVMGTETDRGDLVDVNVGGTEHDDRGDTIDVSLLAREHNDTADFVDVAVGGYELGDEGDFVGVNVLPQTGCAVAVDAAGRRTCAPSLDRRALPP